MGPLFKAVQLSVTNFGKMNGRPAFLAIKEKIRGELSQGVYASLIYAKYKAALPFGYRQFLHYVVEYRLRDAPETKCQPAATAASHDSGATALREPRGAGQRQLPTFEYDPMDAYQKPK